MNAFKKFSYDFRLDGKTAIVSGGTSGIGLETARILSQKGAEVIIFGRRPTTKKIADDIGENVRGMIVDITDTPQITEAVEEIIKTNGKIDILVNCAAIGSGKPAVDITEDEFMSYLSMNIKSTFMVTQAVGRRMIEAGNGGKVINIASDASVVAVPDHVAYCASKAGVVAMTKTLALEWAKYGISCNCVSPTVVMTPMAKEYWVGERVTERLAQVPFGRFVETDEVASLICYLASDAASMIIGQNIVMDGGFTIY